MINNNFEGVNTPDVPVQESGIPVFDKEESVETKPTEAAAEPQKVAKKARKPLTDTERKAQWNERLLNTKIVKDPLFIETLTGYAVSHRGYDERKNWGSTLIRMFEHLEYRLLNRLETFTPEQGEHLGQRLMEFLMKKPLGDNPRVWNTRFQNNADQRKAVDVFYGLNCRMADIKAEDKPLLAVRDSAWPSKIEEEKGIGGSFAERYHYLVTAIVGFLTTGQELINGMFGPTYHDAPTDDYIAWETKQKERLAAKYGHRTPRVVSWYRDGKCTECGADITKDSEGNIICSNPLCSHNIAPVVGATPASFGRRPPRSERERQIDVPNKGQRRDGRDRRHDRDESDRDVDTRNLKRNKRTKFRENNGEIKTWGGSNPQGTAGDTTAYTTPGSENLGGGAFDSLALS